MVSMYSNDLWAFCRYITGSPWDGEDLYQETMLKSFALLPQRWSEITEKKQYLFRVATNTWLDLCRKTKRDMGVLEEVSEPLVDFTEPLLLEEVLVSLATILTPKQNAAFLLMDVFQFNAAEVASFIHSTPGAIYAAVQRARKKITTLDITQSKVKTKETINNPTIEAYLKAFNDGDLKRLLSLFSDQAQNECFFGFQEFSKDEMRKGSLKWGLPGNTAKQLVLWNRPVILVLFNNGDQQEIHDIQFQEVENGKIVSHKSYFFRKELLFAASKELGLKVQLVKPPVDWS